jgi:hypothetical protein
MISCFFLEQNTPYHVFVEPSIPSLRLNKLRKTNREPHCSLAAPRLGHGSFPLLRRSRGAFIEPSIRRLNLNKLQKMHPETQCSLPAPRREIRSPCFPPMWRSPPIPCLHLRIAHPEPQCSLAAPRAQNERVSKTWIMMVVRLLEFKTRCLKEATAISAW